MSQPNETLIELDGLMAALRELLPELRERWHVSYLGVFGSYVRGEQRPSSDLDLLVDFDGPISLFGYVELENYLSDTLGVQVDLVDRKGLKPRIGRYILAEVQPL